MRGGANAKPMWWLLYAIVLLLLGLLGLVELAVPEGSPRTVLEIVVVVATFALMLIWVRRNRVAVELAQWDAQHPRRGLPIVPPAAERGPDDTTGTRHTHEWNSRAEAASTEWRRKVR